MQPAAANNVTATCTGTTTNQGAACPRHCATGHGTGVATLVTRNVLGVSLSGTNYGILVGDGTVTNNASITSGWFGILANTGFANVTNSGSITGTIRSGIYATTNAAVTNTAGASITGGEANCRQHFAEVTNSGASPAPPPPASVLSPDKRDGTNNTGSCASPADTGLTPPQVLPM